MSPSTGDGPRVLVLGTVLEQPPGGVRRHAAELLPRAAALLAAAGGELALLEPRGRLTLALPASVRRLPAALPARPPALRAWCEGRALARTLSAARAAGRPFHVVHTAHQPVPGRAALGDAALVTTVHDLRQLDRTLVGPLRAALAPRLFAAAARRSARILFVSEHVRDRFLARFPAARGRTLVVPNAGDHLRAATADRAAPGLRPGYLLHVGHLEPRKNLALVIDALAHDPQLPPLVLAGAAKGREAERLERRARARGVRARLRLLGPVAEVDLPALYAGAGAVVVPSRLEGFGLAAEEARGLGVRLAVARAGALVEVAGPGVPNFPPDDPGACAAALRAALAGPPPRPSGRTWDASAARLVAAWTEAQNTSEVCR